MDPFKTVNTPLALTGRSLPNSTYYDPTAGRAIQYDALGKPQLPNPSPIHEVLGAVSPKGADPGIPAALTGGTSAAVDPYAKYGGKAAFDNLQAGFGTQRQSIFDTTREAAGSEGLNLKNSILDFVDSLRMGQNTIDKKGVNNELYKKQGSSNVLEETGKGLRSAGTIVQNRNAGASSAVGEIAKAYADMARRGLTDVNNKYEMGNNDILGDQSNLDIQRAGGERKIRDSKTQVVNSLVGQARDKIAALTSAMAGADMPTRLDLNAEINNIRGQVLGQLAQYDSLLATESGKVKATSQSQRQGEANRLANAGTVAEGAFDFSTDAPEVVSDTGPFPGNLPIFTYNKRRTA